MNPSDKPSLENIEKHVNTLASDLIFLDCKSSQEFTNFFQSVCKLKDIVSGANSGLESIHSIIEISEREFEHVSDQDESTISEFLTCLITALQSLLKDFKQKTDVSNYPSKFEEDVKIIASGQEVPKKKSIELSDSQKKVLPEFISSAGSLLEEIERDVLALEKNASDPELFNRVFRHFHSIKGESNILGLVHISSLVHTIEDVLAKIRGDVLKIDSEIINVLLKAIDGMKKHLDLLSSDFNKAIEEDFLEATESVKALLNSPNDVEEQGQEDKQQEESTDRKEETEEKVEEEEEYVPKVPQLDFSEGTDILTEFIAEALDHLTTAEDCIMNLENNPDDKEAVDAIFRSFHTIKGLAGFLELEDIRSLSHTSETMLDMVRNAQLSFEGAVADITFDSIDNLRKLINLVNEQVTNNGQLQSPYHNVGPLIAQLKGIISGRASEPKPKSQKPIGEILIDEGDVTPEEVDEALEIQRDSAPEKKIGNILQDMNATGAKNVDKAVGIQKGVVETSIKINIDKLDALIDLVGEMVITETQVVHNPIINRMDDRRLRKDLSELDRITRRLQEVAMAMRLVPVKPTFQKMLRIIRDLSKKTKKDIDVRLVGEETEIDKNMVELVSDPLVHMVRNAADHGIESVENRLQKGKSGKGNIELAAYHKGGNVVVEIRDDGAGLDKEKILKKATERGLTKEGEHLPDSKIFHMIFAPGFSTAEEVTDVSGRGVGMDVVKRNIEQLRGKIDITSEKDKGSVFSIQLPITLAIIEGIVVTVGEERYILPINSVIEFVQPAEKNLTDVASQGEVFRVHEKIHPLIRLGRYFNVESKFKDFEDSTVCLIESDFGRACLLVDELLGQQQVVIKSLGEKLKSIKGVSGGAILGDGRVGLILDVNGIVDLARSDFSVETAELGAEA